MVKGLIRGPTKRKDFCLYEASGNVPETLQGCFLS